MGGFADRLYAASPVWMQNIAVAAYGAYLHRRRYAGKCRDYAQELAANEKKSASELQALQEQLLRRLLDEVVSRTPWYRDLAKRAGFQWQDVRDLDDLRQLPLLNKETVRAENTAFVSGFPAGERVYTSSTSGTTNMPLTVYMNRTTDRRSYAFYLRQMAWMGVTMGDRRATFFGRMVVPPHQDGPPYWRYDPSESNWQFSSYHISPRSLPHYGRKLAEIRPVEIRGYPSSIAAVARFLVEDRSVTVRPKAVHTTAETLSPDARRLIETAFEAPVFDQYGSSEMSHFVTQCERGVYHAHPEYGVVEVLRDGKPAGPGETGEVVATSFVALCMPLIRYRLGDLMEVDGSPCGCGRAFPTFRRVLGRQDDVIVTPDGRLIGRLDPAFKGVEGILESQVEQVALDHVVVRIVPSPEFRNEAAEVIRRQVAERLGPAVSVSTEIHGSLARGPGGKLRAVIALRRTEAPPSPQRDLA